MFGKLFKLFSHERKKVSPPTKQIVYGIDGESYIAVLKDFNSTFMDFHLYVNKVFNDNLTDRKDEGHPRENYKTVNYFYQITKELVLFQEGLISILEKQFNIYLKADFLLYASNRPYILHEKKLNLRQTFNSGFLNYDKNEENAYNFWWKLTHTGKRGSNGTGHYDIWMKLITDLLGMIEIYTYHSGIKKKTYSRIAKDLKTEIEKNGSESLSNALKIILFYDAIKFPVHKVLEPNYSKFFISQKIETPFDEDEYLTDVLVYTAILLSGGYSPYGYYTNYSEFRNNRHQFITSMRSQKKSYERFFFKEDD